MTIKRALLALIAVVFVMVARSSPALAQGEHPYIEGMDYKVVTCAPGVEGTCFKILKSRDIAGTSAFAREFDTTPQKIRADNPTTTIPVCCSKPGRCDMLRLPGLQTRTTNDHWRLNCPDETKQAVVIVPGETIVLSGKQRLTFNQKFSLLNRMETTPDVQDVADAAKKLAANVKDNQRIVVLPPPPSESKEPGRPAEPLETPDLVPLPPPPYLTQGENVAMIIALISLGIIAGLVFMVVCERRKRLAAERKHAESADAADSRHSAWARAQQDVIEGLQAERDLLNTQLETVLESGVKIVGAAANNPAMGLGARVGLFVNATYSALDALHDAAAHAKTNPANGIGATLNAVVASNRLLDTTNEELAKTKRRLELLCGELDEGLRMLYGRFMDRTCLTLASGAVRRAVDELANAIHRSIRSLAVIASGEDAGREMSSFDLSDLARVTDELAALDTELAGYCGDEAPPGLVGKGRVITEGQKGTVATYRDEISKQAREIGLLRHHNHRLEAELARCRDDDPPDDGSDGSPRTMRPSDLPVPPSPDDSAEAKWSVIGTMSADFVRAVRLVAQRDHKRSTGNQPIYQIEIKRPEHFFALQCVFGVLRSLYAFLPEVNGSPVHGSRPFLDLVRTDDESRAIQAHLTSCITIPPPAGSDFDPNSVALAHG